MEIAKGIPEIGVTDATEQFLLTLVEELVHPKVAIYALNHPTRWMRLISQLTKTCVLPPIYRQGIRAQEEWRRNYREWVTKAIAARLIGRSDLLTEVAAKVAPQIWDEVK